MNQGTIKAIKTKNFSVELAYSHDDMYIIRYGRNNEEVKASENIKDLNIASMLFDLKVEELEGH